MLAANGSMTDDEEYAASPQIEVEGGSTYTFTVWSGSLSAKGSVTVCFYKADTSLMSNQGIQLAESVVGGQSYTFKTPADAGYVRIGLHTPELGKNPLTSGYRAKLEYGEVTSKAIWSPCPLDVIVGATVTAEKGEDAAVEVDLTNNNLGLKFTLPQGEKGATGDRGKQGNVLWTGSDLTTLSANGYEPSVGTVGRYPEAGDFFLNTTTGDLSEVTGCSDGKATVKDTPCASLKGPQGDKGDVGYSGTNLISISSLTAGRLDTSGVPNTDGSTHVHTAYIPLKPNTPYTISGFTVVSGTYVSLAFYDSSKTFISRPTGALAPSSTPWNTTVTSPANAAYAIVSFPNEMKGKIKLAVGSVSTDWSPCPDDLIQNLKIGTVSTLSTGANATATVTGEGSTRTLNLGLPRGEKGDKGDPGDGAVVATASTVGLVKPGTGLTVDSDGTLNVTSSGISNKITKDTDYVELSYVDSSDSTNIAKWRVRKYALPTGEILLKIFVYFDTSQKTDSAAFAYISIPDGTPIVKFGYWGWATPLCLNADTGEGDADDGMFLAQGVVAPQTSSGSYTYALTPFRLDRTDLVAAGSTFSINTNQTIEYELRYWPSTDFTIIEE